MDDKTGSGGRHLCQIGRSRGASLPLDETYRRKDRSIGRSIDLARLIVCCAVHTASAFRQPRQTGSGRARSRPPPADDAAEIVALRASLPAAGAAVMSAPPMPRRELVNATRSRSLPSRLAQPPPPPPGVPRLRSQARRRRLIDQATTSVVAGASWLVGAPPSPPSRPPLVMLTNTICAHHSLAGRRPTRTKRRIHRHSSFVRLSFDRLNHLAGPFRPRVSSGRIAHQQQQVRQKVAVEGRGQPQPVVCVCACVASHSELQFKNEASRPRRDATKTDGS
jgi:hypothetical protein